MQPRFPMQPRMGPGFSGRGPFMGMNRMPQQNPFFGGSPQMNRGGGLLSKLLGRGAPGRGIGMNGMMGMQSANRAAAGGGSLLQNLSNPSGISGILNNTQQVLKTAQTIGPMIQQYGPIVKNLPAMWKLYRGFKSISADTATVEEKQPESSSKTSSVPKEKNAKSKQSSASHSSKNTQNHRKTAVSKGRGDSIPKLYI